MILARGLPKLMKSTHVVPRRNYGRSAIPTRPQSAPLGGRLAGAGSRLPARWPGQRAAELETGSEGGQDRIGFYALTTREPGPEDEPGRLARTRERAVAQCRSGGNATKAMGSLCAVVSLSLTISSTWEPGGDAGSGGCDRRCDYRYEQKEHHRAAKVVADGVGGQVG